MYSKFPFSLENLPRQRRFGCFSLKFGAVISAVVIILYSVLAIAQCIVILPAYGQAISTFWNLVTLTVVVGIVISHGITLLLSAIMAVGVLKDNPRLIKPWVVWVSIQVMLSILMFVHVTTLNVIDQFNGTSLPVYLFDFLILLIRFYMLVLVGSYHKQLEDEKGEYDSLVTIMGKENWYSA